MDQYHIADNYQWMGSRIVMKLETVKLHQVIDDIEEHHLRHYEEMTEGDDFGKPDVNWELYKALSVAGHMMATTLRDGDILVGYIVFSISNNQRHLHRLEASNEAFFVEQTYRGKWSKALVKYALSSNAQMGIDETNFTLNDDRIGRWLGGIGAKSTYKIWSFNHAH